MIRPAPRESDCDPAGDDPPVPWAAAYGRSFWFAYLANTSLMISISVQFRYADFVEFIGGGEFLLGLIVGIGTIGSLGMRSWQAVGIDRYGPRHIWRLSLVLYIAALLGHLTVSTVYGPWVYVLRIVWSISVAGAFGSSITYVSRRAPSVRMAEMIGMLGTSGFVGMAIGPVIGDLVFGTGAVEASHIRWMFGISAALGVLALVAAQIATFGQPAPMPHRRPPLLWLLGRYHPGTVLLVGVAMGIGLGMPGVFLRTFAAKLDITTLAPFFLVYTAAAFSVRVFTRTLPDRIGVRPVILAGLAALSISMISYLAVRAPWHFALPAVLAGTAHAFLFPSVMAAGSHAFPARYRGLATTLMLSMFDIGALVGPPLIGTLVSYAPNVGLRAYPTMFLTLAGLLAGVAAIYAIAGRASNRAPAPSIATRAAEIDTPHVAEIDPPHTSEPADPYASPQPAHTVAAAKEASGRMHG